MSVRGRGVSVQAERSRGGNLGCLYGFDNASLPRAVDPSASVRARTAAPRRDAAPDADNAAAACAIAGALHAAPRAVCAIAGALHAAPRAVCAIAGALHAAPRAACAIAGALHAAPRAVCAIAGALHAAPRAVCAIAGALHAERGAVLTTVNDGYADTLRAACFPRPGETTAQASRREYAACRGAAALWDMSSFVKLRLDRLTSLRVDRPTEEGRLVYCCLCSADGGVAADITVLREGEDAFYIVAGAELLRQTQSNSFLRAHLGAGVSVRDVSRDVGVLHVAGPRSRDVMRAAAPAADFSPAAHPFGTARAVTLGGRAPD
eukprot:gene33266-46000_t